MIRSACALHSGAHRIVIVFWGVFAGMEELLVWGFGAWVLRKEAWGCWRWDLGFLWGDWVDAVWVGWIEVEYGVKSWFAGVL